VREVPHIIWHRLSWGGTSVHVFRTKEGWTPVDESVQWNFVKERGPAWAKSLRSNIPQKVVRDYGLLNRIVRDMVRQSFTQEEADSIKQKRMAKLTIIALSNLA